jgi:hypothetical protein
MPKEGGQVGERWSPVANTRFTDNLAIRSWETVFRLSCQWMVQTILWRVAVVSSGSRSRWIELEAFLSLSTNGNEGLVYLDLSMELSRNLEMTDSISLL